MPGKQLLETLEINAQMFKPHYTGILLLAGDLKPMFLAFIGGATGLGGKQYKIKPIK